MDGLTVSNAEFLIDTGQPLSEVRRHRLEKQLPQTPSSPSSGGESFASTLNNAIHSVNRVQQEADQKMQELATGKNKNIAEVMIAAEKADIALQLMIQMRNKLIESYQEVMKMQV